MNTIYKILLSTILVSLFAGCSEDDPFEDIPVIAEIKINADVDATTKAPINSTFTTDFSIGVYAKSGPWPADTSTIWIKNDSAIVAGAGGHAVSFSRGPYYYPSNGDTLTFYAFVPFARETTAPGAGTSPVVTHRMSGQEDIMWATAKGQKVGSDPVSDPALSFSHKLTQLQFTFKADVTYVLVNRVVSLKVKSQPSSAIMNVESGVCTFSGSADMQALSPADQSSGILISLGGTNAQSPVMTQPKSGSTAYLLDIVVKPLLGGNVTYSNIPVNINAVAGNAHMITLTFKLLSILPTIGISTWTPSTAGSGTVQ